MIYCAKMKKMLNAIRYNNFGSIYLNLKGMILEKKRNYRFNHLILVLI